MGGAEKLYRKADGKSSTTVIVLVEMSCFLVSRKYRIMTMFAMYKERDMKQECVERLQRQTCGGKKHVGSRKYAQIAEVERIHFLRKFYLEFKRIRKNLVKIQGREFSI